jgi:hypothetical protein
LKQTYETGTAFADTYATAQDRFRRAATEAGLAQWSYPHPQHGRDAEPLALDVALQGPANSERMLVISSGCHGIEGYCGSGIQVALLRDPAWIGRVAASGLSVLYLHALNPHGFSWLRRVTHENVDLNRNFMDFARPLPRNRDYDEIAHLAIPPQWPLTDEVRAEVGRYIDAKGYLAFAVALSRGQYHHPQGQFFGGQAPTWSNLAVRKVLREHAMHAKHLGWIDIHTGLGPCGYGERIFFNRNDAEALRRTRTWWGDSVTSYYDGSSASVELSGNLWCGVVEQCPRAEYTGIALEFGTQSSEQVMLALTADHWLHVQEDPKAELVHSIRQGMRDAFFVDTPQWKQGVLDQAFEVAEQGLVGLQR